MSQNLEVKLARNTELAFTEAHLTFVTLYCSSGFSAGGGAAAIFRRCVVAIPIFLYFDVNQSMKRFP